MSQSEVPSNIKVSKIQIYKLLWNWKKEKEVEGIVLNENMLAEKLCYDDYRLEF